MTFFYMLGFKGLRWRQVKKQDIHAIYNKQHGRMVCIAWLISHPEQGLLNTS